MDIDYLLVDDDIFNNKVCGMTIKNVVPGAKIIAFTDPEKALAFIETTYGTKDAGHTLLLLDINMPVLTGWDFLDRFEKFSKEVRDKISIYMLSSSIDPTDMAKAGEWESVKGFITKPLDKKTFLGLVEEVQR